MSEARTTKTDTWPGKYIITSKDGMTPFAHAATMREARRLASEARQLGLDGEIHKA